MAILIIYHVQWQCHDDTNQSCAYIVCIKMYTYYIQALIAYFELFPLAQRKSEWNGEEYHCNSECFANSKPAESQVF